MLIDCMVYLHFQSDEPISAVSIVYRVAIPDER